MTPYWQDGPLTLYHGDAVKLLPVLQADAIITDPPYGETSFDWDRWPDGWPEAAQAASASLWCFGSLRMFMSRAEEFAGWKLAQDVIWEKHNATGPDADRFRRVHEIIAHWYQGRWRDLHREPQRYTSGVRERGRIVGQGARSIGHRGEYASHHWTDDGTRLMTSVIRARSMHRNGNIHPTEKPAELIFPLLQYAVPPGGLVLDCFAGSGVVLEVARQTGRRAIGIELGEERCARIVERLQQAELAL